MIESIETGALTAGLRDGAADRVGDMADDDSERLESPEASAASEPRGLSGWLGLLTILVLIGGLRAFYFAATEVVPAFWGDTWALLTSSSSEFYHPLWAPLLVFEALANIALGGYALYVFVQFLGEKAAARPHFNTYAVASIVVILIDAVLVRIVLPDEPVLDAENTGALSRAVVFALVWMSYLQGSKRARNTLVR